MDIFFIRHAESEANAEGITSDPEAISLTESGISASITLSEIIEIEPDLIVITKYVRTQQTAASFLVKRRHINSFLQNTLCSVFHK